MVLKLLDYGYHDRLYKYYFSTSSSMEVINAKLKLAKTKGFKNAFIVGFENGIQISLD